MPTTNISHFSKEEIKKRCMEQLKFDERNFRLYPDYTSMYNHALQVAKLTNYTSGFFGVSFKQLLPVLKELSGTKN